MDTYLFFAAGCLLSGIIYSFVLYNVVQAHRATVANLTYDRDNERQRSMRFFSEMFSRLNELMDKNATSQFDLGLAQGSINTRLELEQLWERYNAARTGELSIEEDGRIHCSGECDTHSYPPECSGRMHDPGHDDRDNSGCCRRGTEANETTERVDSPSQGQGDKEGVSRGYAAVPDYGYQGH